MSRNAGDEAGRSIRRAVRLAPDCAEVRLAAARALKDLGRCDEALDECAAALRLTPRDPRALELRGDLELLLERRQAALRSYRSAGASAKAAPVASFLRGLSRRRARSRPCPEILVDARLELLGIVCALAGGRSAGRAFSAGSESAYGVDVLRSFLRLRRHRAVRAWRAAFDAGLDAVDAQRAALYVSPPPALEPVEPQAERLRPLVDELRRFSRAGRFPAFFAARAPLYRSWREDVAAQARAPDCAALLEEYSGLRAVAPYRLILCGLRPAGSLANLHHVARAEDGYRVFSVVGCASFSEGRPVFDFSRWRWNIWHELGHTLFDHRLEEHLELAAASRARLTPALKVRWGSWDQTVREHVVQGLAWRLLSWSAEQGRIKPVNAVPAGKSLPFLSEIIASLKVFERRRPRGGLAAFYPELLRALGSHA